MPALPFLVVLVLRQEDVTRMPRRPHPRDYMNQIRLGHRRASCARPRDAASNVEKNCAARSGNGWIRVVSNFYQPAIREIVVPHFLFFEPRRRVRRVGNRDEAIVIGAFHVIDPRVGFRDLMKRKIGARR